LLAIGGSVELAAGSVDEKHPLNQDLDLAREGLETGRRMVRQLLDVARAEETKAEYVDINEFLSRSTKFFSSMVSRDVALEVVAEPAIGGVMIAPGQLTQVLMNLVLNARDAMSKRGII